MNDFRDLVAFCSTLCVILLLAALSKYNVQDDDRTLDTAIVGLIGLIGTFRPRMKKEDGYADSTIIGGGDVSVDAPGNGVRDSTRSDNS